MKKLLISLTALILSLVCLTACMPPIIPSNTIDMTQYFQERMFASKYTTDPGAYGYDPERGYVGQSDQAFYDNTGLSKLVNGNETDVPSGNYLQINFSTASGMMDKLKTISLAFIVQATEATTIKFKIQLADGQYVSTETVTVESVETTVMLEKDTKKTVVISFAGTLKHRMRLCITNPADIGMDTKFFVDSFIFCATQI